MINKFFLLSIIFYLSGCGATNTIYYGNYTNTNRNLQQDIAICKHYADSIVSHIDTGNHNQQSIYINSADNYNNTIEAINNFGALMNRSNVYSNAYSACIAKLGWVQISKDEYNRIIGNTSYK